MSFRFRKSIRIAPGVRLNLSKSGLSTSIGKPGATLNLSKRGAKATAGLPGTGLSYSTQLGGTRTRPASNPPSPEAGAPIVLDAVEYAPGGDVRHGETRTKRDQLFCGIGERASDGLTCLAVMSPGSTRRHNIEVGSIVSVTVDGVRSVLEVAPDRWRLREQELTALITGRMESWALPYFDPDSPKYHGREDAAAEPALAAAGFARGFAQGAGGSSRSGFWIGVILVVAFLAWLGSGRTTVDPPAPRTAIAAPDGVDAEPDAGAEPAAVAVEPPQQALARGRDLGDRVRGSVRAAPTIDADPEEIAADQVTAEVNARRAQDEAGNE